MEQRPGRKSEMTTIKEKVQKDDCETSKRACKPDVGIEPTASRLEVLRATDCASRAVLFVV